MWRPNRQSHPMSTLRKGGIHDQTLSVNLSMTSEPAAAYKSGAQRARVVTEFWGAENLYCPNCTSPKISRLSHNTRAVDFKCPTCEFEYQLKGQQSPLGNRIV